MLDPGVMTPIRIRRLASELRMRRRLDVYGHSARWPGKKPAWRFELVRYDRLLVLAAQMLQVAAPEPPSRWPLAAGCVPCSRTAWHWPVWTCWRQPAWLPTASRRRAPETDARPPSQQEIANRCRTIGWHGGPWGGRMEVLKVSSKSSPNSCAGAMAGVVRSSGAVEVQVVGAGALNQAVKAIAIARGYLAPAGVDLVCVPTFADIEIDGQSRTAIRLLVEDRHQRTPPDLELRDVPSAPTPSDLSDASL